MKPPSDHYDVNWPQPLNTLPPPPEVPPAPAAPPPVWHKFLQRKFLMSLTLLVLAVVGLASGRIPWGWEVVAGIVGLVWAWIQGETRLDLARIRIPERPGVLDDVLRGMQKVLLAVGGEKPEKRD